MAWILAGTLRENGIGANSARQLAARPSPRIGPRCAENGIELASSPARAETVETMLAGSHRCAGDGATRLSLRCERLIYERPSILSKGIYRTLRLLLGYKTGTPAIFKGVVKLHIAPVTPGMRYRSQLVYSWSKSLVPKSIGPAIRIHRQPASSLTYSPPVCITSPTTDTSSAVHVMEKNPDSTPEDGAASKPKKSAGMGSSFGTCLTKNGFFRRWRWNAA
ncbi:hypothetical protein EIP91_004268 [Steccherinum ochraceum]|uniref:Uncharacterized protein n=1 Tax=Steccherinum ochraceum TaxID=92696 RepID=A0A4R0R963_9APHY|nr:hypothetical protein EIP91_004268 [Steccherinum ochraceum]